MTQRQTRTIDFVSVLAGENARIVDACDLARSAVEREARTITPRR